MTSLRLPGIEACVFDAYGTLFDVNSAARSAPDDERSLEAMGVDPARLPARIGSAARDAGAAIDWLALSDAYVVMSGCRNNELSREFIDEQAGAILFLASDDAAYITGVTLPVGGGDLG